MKQIEILNRLRDDFGLYSNYLSVSMLLPKISSIDVRNEYMTDISSFIFNELSSIFNEGQIEKIYLNFSDPWPKKRYAKRRLLFSSHLWN